MNLIKAEEKDIILIHDIIKKSVEVTYRKYYPEEVVQFFLMIHSEKNIRRDFPVTDMYLLEDKGDIVGTGSCREDKLSRLYILPQYQKMGYGTFLMDFLEGEVFKNHSKAYLSPSLPGVKFYEKRGYKIVEHEDCQLKNGVILAHDTMEKEFKI